MRHKDVSLKSIRVPIKHRRIDRDDGTIFSSIKSEGLKVPVVVVQNGDEYILADGSRRVAVARRLKWDTIKAFVRKVPNGQDPEAYASFLRLTVNHHRQGFYPSQRAHYLTILCDKHNYPMEEIAKACGVTRNGLKSWMAVNDCSEEIKMFIDDGKFPVDAGRLIKSLKPSGQVMVANKFRDRPKVSMPELRQHIKVIHRRHPEAVKISMRKASKGRAVKPHTNERKAYGRFSNMSLSEMEDKISTYENEITFMMREILRAKPIIQRMCRNGKIRLALPGTTLKRFEDFLSED